MGYITLMLPEAQLLDGMYVDPGTEQHKGADAMAVTLHEEDLKVGTFVRALTLNGHLTPFTWTFDGGDHRAAPSDSVQHGGTLEQFLHHCAQAARFALVHGWAPRVLTHVPREQ